MFVQMKNFSVVATYAQMFQEGLVVTILLQLPALPVAGPCVPRRLRIL